MVVPHVHNLSRSRLARSRCSRIMVKFARSVDASGRLCGVELTSLIDRASTEISSAADLESLAEIERSFVGKKGELVGLKKTLGSLAPEERKAAGQELNQACLLYTSPSPRDLSTSRMPSSA